MHSWRRRVRVGRGPQGVERGIYRWEGRTQRRNKGLKMKRKREDGMQSLRGVLMAEGGGTHGQGCTCFFPNYKWIHSCF
jgi:hypothetical protein